MKRLLAVLTLMVLTASGARAATYTLLPVNANTNWYHPIWDIGSYPKAADDVAVISNANVSFPTTSLSISLGMSITVGVIRTAGTTTNVPWVTISSDSGSVLYFQSSDGRAVVEAAGMNAGSWQLHLNSRMTLLSDLEARCVSNKIFMFGSGAYDIAGASNLYLRNLATGSGSYGTFDTRMPASPNFTGELHLEGRPYVSVGHDAANNRYIMTNALVIVEPGTALLLRSYVSNLGYRVVCRSGSTLQAHVNQPANFRTPVEIHGWVTNTVWAGGFAFNLRGDVSGTGTIFRLGQWARMTNCYVGSVSPGLSGPGTITFMSSLAAGGTTSAWANALLLGEAGDPLQLVIEDGDQVIVTNRGEVLNLALLDVTFLTTTLQGTTNWFLQSGDGFAGGAFNSVDWGIFNGYCVSNVAGMENYIGAVVVPEPALLLLLGLCGLVASRFRG